MMQVYADTTSGADRASKFGVRKVRRVEPNCAAGGEAGECSPTDEISFR